MLKRLLSIAENSVEDISIFIKLTVYSLLLSNVELSQLLYENN